MKLFSSGCSIVVFYSTPLTALSLFSTTNKNKHRWSPARTEVKRRNTNRNSSRMITPIRNIDRCNNFISCQSDDHAFLHDEVTSSVPRNQGGGTYRRFAEYAWEKILQSGLLSDSDDILPEGLASNSSPAKGFPEGSTVNIELKKKKCAAKRDGTTTMGDNSPLRLARYALLETVAGASNEEEDGGSFQSVPQGIHVLNLVVFPQVSALAFPVLGVDLVTLPGGKHLMAIDFQPIVPLPQGESINIFPQPFEHYETKLQALHQKYVLDQRDVMPWGGDLPPQAQRFFSPYALWTRIQEKQMGDQKRDCQSIIEKEVFDAFCAYFDLYLEIMMDIKNDCDTINNGDARNDVVWQGHVDYLNYRRDNDPARPMLTRLYGEDYAERVIREVLFQMIE